MDGGLTLKLIFEQNKQKTNKHPKTTKAMILSFFSQINFDCVSMSFTSLYIWGSFCSNVKVEIPKRDFILIDVVTFNCRCDHVKGCVQNQTKAGISVQETFGQ